MILYHGSNLEVTTPDLKHSRSNVDFGCGFYTTPIHEQAANWCRRFIRRGDPGIVSCYDFDEVALQDLAVLRFDSYSEEWLDFIMSCRNEEDTSAYDIVIGGVANDKVFNTIELYFDIFSLSLFILLLTLIVCPLPPILDFRHCTNISLLKYRILKKAPVFIEFGMNRIVYPQEIYILSTQLSHITFFQVQIPKLYVYAITPQIYKTNGILITERCNHHGSVGFVILG